jgi:RNA polymerase sigma-70 factor (ECF subfamily)
VIALTSPRAPSVAAIDLDAVYREHVDYVWITLRRLGVAAADLEDVAHEVFVTVHRRLGEFDRTRAVRPWIFGIALRVASRYRRSIRRRREVHDDQLDSASDATGDELLARREAHRIVFDALDRLSVDQRAVFVLFELEGRTAPEIADELGLPLNTVYSRLRIARDRFTAAVCRLRDKESKR